MAVWGVHNDALSTELIEGGFISIGWDLVGDLRDVGLTREHLKAALTKAYPDDKPRAIAGWAGILLRFASEISEGDVIVAPYRPDSTINIGVVTGPYEFHPEVPSHKHRRAVVGRSSVSRARSSLRRRSTRSARCSPYSASGSTPTSSLPSSGPPARTSSRPPLRRLRRQPQQRRPPPPTSREPPVSSATPATSCWSG